uniref:Eukaryotic translation initiation factor 2 beta subunit n=1 Tax=Arundo donax TaxID=35708 RepID=A0A0A9E8X2_ARUDO
MTLQPLLLWGTKPKLHEYSSLTLKGKLKPKHYVQKKEPDCCSTMYVFASIFRA